MKRLITMMAMASISMMTMAQGTLGSGLDVTDLNTSVQPGDDFYEFACGGWMKKHPLPAAYSRYGSFDKLQEDNDKPSSQNCSRTLMSRAPQNRN